MILYYPTKFHFNTINSFKVMDRGHFPRPPGPGTQKKPGPDRDKMTVISNSFKGNRLGEVNISCQTTLGRFSFTTATETVTPDFVSTAKSNSTKYDYFFGNWFLTFASVWLETNFWVKTSPGIFLTTDLTFAGVTTKYKTFVHSSK